MTIFLLFILFINAGAQTPVYPLEGTVQFARNAAANTLLLKPSGLNKTDYLHTINGIVQFFRQVRHAPWCTGVSCMFRPVRLSSFKLTRVRSWIRSPKQRFSTAHHALHLPAQLCIRKAWTPRCYQTALTRSAEPFKR